MAVEMLTAKASTEAITSIEKIYRFLEEERIRLRRDGDSAGLAANARAIAYWRTALNERRRDFRRG